MSVYFDVSVLVALFAVGALNDRASHVLRTLDDIAMVSDFATAEFSSVIALRVRTRDLRPDDARSVFSNFDIGQRSALAAFKS